MSQSPRANVVRAFIERIATYDFDGAHKLATDDFLYKTEPKPPVEFGLGHADSYDKVKHKQYGAKLAERFGNYKVIIDSMTETGETVIVKSRFQASYAAPNAEKVAVNDSPYNAVFTFSGNKIKFVDAVTSAEFVAKHRAF